MATTTQRQMTTESIDLMLAHCAECPHNDLLNDPQVVINYDFRLGKIYICQFDDKISTSIEVDENLMPVLGAKWELKS